MRQQLPTMNDHQRDLVADNKVPAKSSLRWWKRKRTIASTLILGTIASLFAAIIYGQFGNDPKEAAGNVQVHNELSTTITQSGDNSHNITVVGEVREANVVIGEQTVTNNYYHTGQPNNTTTSQANRGTPTNITDPAGTEQPKIPEARISTDTIKLAIKEVHATFDGDVRIEVLTIKNLNPLRVVGKVTLNKKAKKYSAPNETTIIDDERGNSVRVVEVEEEYAVFQITKRK